MAPYKFEAYRDCVDYIRSCLQEEGLTLEEISIGGGFDERTCKRIVRFSVSAFDDGDGSLGFVMERVVTDATRVYATDEFKQAVEMHARLLSSGTTAEVVAD